MYIVFETRDDAFFSIHWRRNSTRQGGTAFLCYGETVYLRMATGRPDVWQMLYSSRGPDVCHITGHKAVRLFTLLIFGGTSGSTKLKLISEPRMQTVIYSSLFL